jgi:GDP-4-dehydro-6-deoxy-D-mannose reductase
VYGVDLRLPARPIDGVKLYEADLRQPERLASLLAEIQPQMVFHLAAQAAVPESWSNPADTYINNTLGQLNVLQAILASHIDPAILVVGSNEEYGRIRPDEVPVAEGNPLRPVNPYAVSKIVQDMMGYQYFASHGLRCVRVRPFNHTGPRQSEAFVVPALGKQIAEIEAGLREPVVLVGNLDVQRDFTDVRDMVRAYYLALLQGEPGEVYNLGSGKAVAVRWILDYLVARCRVPVEVKVDAARLRPSDVPLAVCNFSKFRSRTGWQPQIPLEQTLIDTLEYWRQRTETQVAGLRR